MTATQTNVIAVIKADRTGATVNVRGKRQTISWDALRAAAGQDDAELRAVYSDVLSEARRLASLEKTLTVRINNRTNTPHGHEAELYDVAGEFISGRIVAADFGLAGTLKYAERDADDAVAKLTARGYTVTRG